MLLSASLKSQSLVKRVCSGWVEAQIVLKHLRSVVLETSSQSSSVQDEDVLSSTGSNNVQTSISPQVFVLAERPRTECYTVEPLRLAYEPGMEQRHHSLCCRSCGVSRPHSAHSLSPFDKLRLITSGRVQNGSWNVKKVPGHAPPAWMSGAPDFSIGKAGHVSRESRYRYETT